MLREEDGLGVFYQALNGPALEAAYRGTAREGRKFSPGEIPAVTQLFTPRWVVDFLLQNSLGRMWMEWHPDSSLGYNWEGLVPVERSGKSRARLVRELRVCDPACGTMNFGLAALDMFRLMYREEMEKAGRRSWPAEPSCSEERRIDEAILSHNLVGFDIDPAALELARISLELKTGLKILPSECGLRRRDSLLGEDDGERFDVVVTNPPYLSARNLDPAIVKKLKTRYPAGWRDFYACFLLRSLAMLSPGGRAGILCMQSFMFTSAFERLREEIGEMAGLEHLAHFGPGLFGVGNPGTLQTCAAVFSRRPSEAKRATFFRLTDLDDKAGGLRREIEVKRRGTDGAASAGERTFEVSHNDLASLPRSAWMYWISPGLRRAFTEFPALAKVAQPRQGLATTDNARFVRYWWEVERPGHVGERAKWKPYAKGGGFRRWYEAARYRVNWEDEGREIKESIVSRYPYLEGQWQWVAKNSTLYGKPGITYSYLSAGRFSARRLEKGTIFDVAGSAMFPEDPLPLLGVLNSSTAARLLEAINPTINFQVGDLGQLPVPLGLSAELSAAVGRAIEVTRKLDGFDETSVDFVAPAPWAMEDTTEGDLRRGLSDVERVIDRIVGEGYGVDVAGEERAGWERDRGELARRWVSYAVGACFGRWKGVGGNPMEVMKLVPLCGDVRERLREILVKRAGGGDVRAADEIEGVVGGLERFLSREFFEWHGRVYRGRPVFWGFGDSTRVVMAVNAVDADSLRVGEAIGVCGVKLPRGWERVLDDGVVINLAPLGEYLADRKLAKVLCRVWGDLGAVRYGFARTAQLVKGSIGG
jgi:hypothetical protein